MSPRSVLSPEERDALLREIRGGSGRTPAGAPPPGATPIPVRTFRVFPLRAPGGASGGAPRPPDAGPGEPARSGFGRGGAAGGAPPGPRGRGILPPLKKPSRRRILLGVLAALVIVLGLGTAKLLSVGSAVLTPERSIVRQLADLLFRRRVLAGERDNRVNILLVAIGGEGHQGENLADSVILASLRPLEKDVALLGIPRDLYVKIPSTEFFTRINAVHAYGENQRRGEGLKLLRQKTAEIAGQPVHYVARVDFTAFKRIVDEIGGIDITIPKSFYDYWHKISFPEGTEHMNGERALAYVRARYVEGPEGGDFKRAERTQQVILAIRRHMLSAQTAVDLRALAGILDALRDNVATNFTLSELKRLAELTRDIADGQIHTAVLTTGADGLLVGTTEVLSGRPAAVLRPRAGLEQFGEIQTYVRDIFTAARVAPPPAAELPPGETPSPASGPKPSAATVAEEQPTVEFRNGTNVTGLAARAAKALEKKLFTISAIGNAALRNRTQTIVVDRTGGKKPVSLQELLETLGVTTTVSFPEAEKDPVDASFIVFLGTDVSERFKR